MKQLPNQGDGPTETPLRRWLGPPCCRPRIPMTQEEIDELFELVLAEQDPPVFQPIFKKEGTNGNSQTN
jgi:hypothetical protein